MNAEGGLPVVLMRGGTSKGVFLHRRDMPARVPDWDDLVLRLLGSPDPMQLDGLGGSYSSTSKVVVVDVDDDGLVRYRFGQVAVDEAHVDWGANCGNLTTAVGVFALEEGLVPAVRPSTTVRLLNENTRRRIDAEIRVGPDGVEVAGDTVVAGVPGTGSPIRTDYLDPAGSVLDGLLPTGRTVDRVGAGDDGGIEVAGSIVDATSPYVFVAADRAGVDPHRTTEELNQDSDLLSRLEQLRQSAAVLCGARDGDAAFNGGAAYNGDGGRDGRAARGDAIGLSPTVPRICVVEPVADVERDRGRLHIRARALSMGRFHHAVPMTAAMCLAAATWIPDTVPGALARSVVPRFVPPDDADEVTVADEATVLVHHAKGSAEIHVTGRISSAGEHLGEEHRLRADERDAADASAGSVVQLSSLGVVRTARTLIRGRAYPAPRRTTPRTPLEETQ